VSYGAILIHGPHDGRKIDIKFPTDTIRLMPDLRPTSALISNTRQWVSQQESPVPIEDYVYEYTLPHSGLRVYIHKP